MNNIRYISIILMSLFTLVSCNQNLDEVPLSTLTPTNLFQTEGDANVAAVGMYNGLLSANTWGVTTPVRGW